MNFTEKYQPKIPQQIIGQSQRTIAESLAKLTGTNIKPILLVGSSGTGKTTLAKMFAEMLDNAEIIHVNCGEKSGVQEARDLVGGFGFGSLFNGYRVYFLDEVHRLTKQAQEVFLIPLETGLNAKTVVIAATTETSGLVSTFLSRFSKYELDPPSFKEMKRLTQTVAKKEGFNLSDELEKEIIIKSRGNVRDLVNYLEQIAHENYTSSVELETQSVNTIELLRNKDITGLLSIQTNDYNSLLIGVCTYVIKVLQSNPNDEFGRRILQNFGNGLNQNVPQNIAWAYLVGQYLDNK